MLFIFSYNVVQSYTGQCLMNNNIIHMHNVRITTSENKSTTVQHCTFYDQDVKTGTNY